MRIKYIQIQKLDAKKYPVLELVKYRLERVLPL